MNQSVATEATAEMQIGGHREFRTESGRVSDSVASGSSFGDNLSAEVNVLIQQMVETQNMSEAIKRVRANKGAPGIDGRTVDDLTGLLRVHWPKIKEDLLKGSYRPSPVLRVNIPKPQGGTRPLGIPTVLDRVIQQALHQVLSPIFEKEFSVNSYGFRPGKSAKQAVEAAQAFQKDGKRIVVDMDLKSFFDEVNHDILMGLIRKQVKDTAVLKLIRKFLQNGIMDGGICTVPIKGTPQGGPLSPLLSNIILNELDNELEKRGHSFCRYADDCNIYVKSKQAGKRVFESIARFVESRLKLKVNYEKSAVDYPQRRKFLGFSFTWKKEIRVSKEAKQRLKSKVRTLCKRGRGRNLDRFIKYDLNPLLRGWFNYFKTADAMKTVADELDQWIRHRLRNIKWRQWKRGKRRFKELMKRGLKEERARESAFNGRGPWWNSGASHMNQALPIKYFEEKGLFSLLDNYL